MFRGLKDFRGKKQIAELLDKLEGEEHAAEQALEALAEEQRESWALARVLEGVIFPALKGLERDHGLDRGVRAGFEAEVMESSPRWERERRGEEELP